MINLVLVAPEIPGNTGAIIRLCANTGARLHLVQPLGFSLESSQLRRAGLDYHDLATMQVWPDFAACRGGIDVSNDRWFATTGRATRRYTDVAFQADDVIVFGCEASGLPDEVLNDFTDMQCLSIPMRPNNRSINLANAAAIITYEAWRQLAFESAISVSSTISAITPTD